MEELKEIFEIEIKKLIKNKRIYNRHINRLIGRIDESKRYGYIVKPEGENYIKEDWKGIVIQGNINI